MRSDFNGTSASDSFIKTPTIKCIQLFINGELLNQWRTPRFCSNVDLYSFFFNPLQLLAYPLYNSSSRFYAPKSPLQLLAYPLRAF
ncbi:hypothetical protein TB2_034610 [Malus domestica]